MNRIRQMIIWWRLRRAMRHDDYELAEKLALQTGDPDLRKLVLRNRILKILREK